VKGTVLAHQADGALRIKTVIGGKTFTGSIREVRGYHLSNKTSYQSIHNNIEMIFLGFDIICNIIKMIHASFDTGPEALISAALNP
jgi:hypothetical protein